MKKTLVITLLGLCPAAYSLASEDSSDSVASSMDTLSYHHSHHLYHVKKVTGSEIPYRPAYFKKEMERVQREGIRFSSNYVADVAGNPTGGMAKGFCYAGSLGMFFNFDLYKDHQGDGADLYFTATWRKGDSLSAKKIGNAFSVMQVYGSETLQLANASLKITGLNQRLNLFFGRISSGDLFLSSPYYSYYVNNSINGNPISILFNLPFYVYPTSTWGSALNITTEKFEARVGIYNTNPKVARTKYHGLNFSFHSPLGALVITELNFKIGQGIKPHYEGNYKVGVAALSGNQEKILGGQERGNYNYYFLADQVFFQRDTIKAGAFFSYLGGPSSFNLFPAFINGGIVAKGLMPFRPNDSTNFGFSWGRFSHDQRTLNMQQGEPLQHAETDLEINHLFYLNKHSSIQPALQYVIHPNGESAIPNAFVLSMQISLAY